MSNWYDRSTLPKFRRPPVVETALAVEFAPVLGLDVFRLSRVQEKWASTYPNVRVVPGASPSQNLIEGPMTLEFAFGPGAPQRIWAESPTTGQLVQTQADRLILNWRKPLTTDPYPGYYSSLRPEFERLWDLLLKSLAEQNLDAPVPTLAEFTYVNQVSVDNDDSLSDIVTLVQSPEVEVPGRDTFGRFQFVRTVQQSETDPFDVQLQIGGEPGAPTEDGRQVTLTSIARVLLGARSDKPLDGLDVAHDLASHTFARIITPAKKALWEQYQ